LHVVRQKRAADPHSGPLGRRDPSGRVRHLPNGPHPLTREQVAENQTARVFAALTDLVAERGYERVTVGMTIARAGISRKTFYDLRGGLDPWFLGLCDSIADRLLARVRDGGAQGDSPAERVAGAVAALIAFADEEPVQSRICFVETLAAGADARAWRGALIARIAAEIARLAPQPDATLAARATVGAAVELATERPDGVDRDRASALVARMLAVPGRDGTAA
jgi:AcrR family transcriptional regulator